MRTNSELRADEARRIFSYSQETGQLRWAVEKSSAKTGALAGHIAANGYGRVFVDRVPYLIHRIAWLYMTGQWPDGDIDHINGNPSDNRWENLRVVSRSHNLHNKDVRGYSLHKHSGKWRARITVMQKEKSLGYFDTKEEAQAAYLRAKKDLGLITRTKPIQE